MKQIYRFEDAAPPRLTESMLRAELAARKLRRQVLLVQIASWIMAAGFALFAFFIVYDSALLAFLSIAALGITLLGNGVIAVAAYRKRRAVPAF